MPGEALLRMPETGRFRASNRPNPPECQFEPNGIRPFPCFIAFADHSVAMSRGISLTELSDG